MLICKISGINLKTIIFILMSFVAVVAGIVRDTNQYFDRILSNVGQEVIFYGLGLRLNFSRILISNQKIVQHLSECKMIFRVVPSCLTGFAEKLDNDTVLCTWFQQPIYQLPTIRKEKGKAFAFYKEQEQVGVSNIQTIWGSLQNNGIFYVYAMVEPIQSSYQVCYNGSYPNGYVLRLKTQQDLDRFTTVFSALYKIGGQPFAIDLIPGKYTLIPVWRDGTPFNQLDAAGFTLTSFSGIDTCVYMSWVTLKKSFALTNKCGIPVHVVCEVNLFP